MAKIIGIDLGTSNSACAVMEHGRPTIVPSAEGTSVGGKAFPSYVAFTKDGQLLVGEPARRQAATNPEGTVIAAKRKMGTDHVFKIHGKEYTPQQISAFILQKVKRDAEAYLGEPVKEAVITVPSGFVAAWRRAGSPTSSCPSFVNATYDGNALPPTLVPSADGMIAGRPCSMTAQAEFDVPRSMPIGLAIVSSFVV